jgi:hypothetical protein
VGILSQYAETDIKPEQATLSAHAVTLSLLPPAPLVRLKWPDSLLETEAVFGDLIIRNKQYRGLLLPFFVEL